MRVDNLLARGLLTEVFEYEHWLRVKVLNATLFPVTRAPTRVEEVEDSPPPHLRLITLLSAPLRGELCTRDGDIMAGSLLVAFLLREFH